MTKFSKPLALISIIVGMLLLGVVLITYMFTSAAGLTATVDKWIIFIIGGIFGFSLIVWGLYVFFRKSSDSGSSENLI